MPDNCQAGVKSILDFARAKREERPVVMLAAYDAQMARLLAASEADAILVGDSVAMVVHGFPSTVHATVEMMVAHTAAVRRGAPEAVVIADMPFLSVRQGRDQAMRAAGALMQAGATAVKVEGVAGHGEIIKHLVESGIPVMGHLGLTPQSVNQLGGFRVQGRDDATAKAVKADAQAVAEAGAFAMVIEAIVEPLAREITKEVPVPTIGIGASPACDGQVLVIDDMLGLFDWTPKFVRRYANLRAEIGQAVRAYAADVRARRFPGEAETYQLVKSA